MTNQHFQALPAAKRGRLIVRAVLRSVLTAVVLVVLYYVVPLDRPWDSTCGDPPADRHRGLRGVMVRQVRAIAGSRYRVCGRPRRWG